MRCELERTRVRTNPPSGAAESGVDRKVSTVGHLRPQHAQGLGRWKQARKCAQLVARQFEASLKYQCAEFWGEVLQRLLIATVAKERSSGTQRLIRRRRADVAYFDDRAGRN